MSKMEKIVYNIAEPLILEIGLELVEVNYIKEGSNWILRIFIENTEGDIGLKECEKVSRILSDELDNEDIISGAYILEVSSPGIERPLKSKEDYIKYRGELISLSLYAPINGEKKYTGKLKGYENDEILLEIKKGVIKLPLNKIADAYLTVDF